MVLPITHSRRRMLALGLLAGTARAASRLDDMAAQRTEQFVNDLVQARHHPGLALAVMREGRPVYVCCWGDARVGQPGAIDEDTRFCIASLSKPFLAQALLMFEQQGRLRLDDPIQHHLGPVPRHWQAITVRQLLNHTSGLRSAGDPSQADDLLFDPGLRAQMQARGGAAFSATEELALLQSFALQARPGQRFRYSNAGYNVLAQLAGRVAGQPYTALLRERLFEPLGMASARFLEADSEFDDMAAPCADDGRALDFATQLPPAYKAFYGGGCGGIQLSLHDLMRWDAALSGRALDGGALPAGWSTHLKALPRLWARTVQMDQGTGEDGRPLRYGLGWIVGHEARGELRLSHGGAIPGYRAHYRRTLGGRQCSVLLLANQAGLPLDRVSATVAAQFAGG